MPSYKTVTDDKSVVWDHYPKRRELVKAHGTADVWLIELDEEKKVVVEARPAASQSFVGSI